MNKRIFWIFRTDLQTLEKYHEVNNLENFGRDVAVGDYNADGYDDIAISAPMEEGIWPYHDFPGYVFIYAGNPGMVANDDPSMPQLSDQLQMRLSPNPALTNGEIIISISGVDINKGMPLKIEIYNLKGQIIHQTEVSSILTNELVSSVNLSNYPAGLYICRARIGDQSIIKKFTIIK